MIYNKITTEAVWSTLVTAAELFNSSLTPVSFSEQSVGDYLECLFGVTELFYIKMIVCFWINNWMGEKKHFSLVSIPSVGNSITMIFKSTIIYEPVLIYII